MTIGKLYNAKNVVVGQAACLLAPPNTVLPPMSMFDINDPFSLVPWARDTILPGASTAFTLTYTNVEGAEISSSLTVSGLTAAAIQTALAALSNVGAGNVFVAGSAGAWTVAFSQEVEPGILSATGTGGTATVENNMWVPNGATDQGWKFTTNKSTTDIDIEEQSPSVLTTLASQKITIEGSLSEDIENTLSVVYNMTQTIVAPTSDTPGYTELAMTDDVLTYAAALIMATKDGYPRVLYIPEVVSLSNAETTLRRAAAKRMYPAVFTSQCATEDIIIRNVTAPATA